MASNPPNKRRNRGDFMSPETRSRVMSRIRGRGTGLELEVASELKKRGVRWESHSQDIPGRPDFLFRTQKVALFVDGDFWHGWRFPLWRDKLSEPWEVKIQANRARDRKNYQKLRRRGSMVIRIWEHQIKKDKERYIQKVLDMLDRKND